MIWKLNVFFEVLASNQNTGNLVIRERSRTGLIWIERGQLISVRFGKHEGPKAFYRLVGLGDGKFEFFSPGREPSKRNMAGSLEWHLLEAARHMDELAVLRQQLPDGETRFAFNQNIIASVARITFPVLEVMAAIHKDESLTGILDGCDLSDLDICRILIKLIKQRVIQPVNEQTVAGKAENVVAWPRESRLPA